MKFVRLLQGKLIVVVLVSVAVVGGATAFAATSTGQGLVHAITGQEHATATPDVDRHENNNQDDNNQDDNDHHASNGDKSNCSGLPAAQRLATQFALSTDSTSDDIQAMCSLHQGTFKGATPNGIPVSSKRVFGYGEIDQLLTYAQFLVGQDKANVGGKLTSANVRGYLAAGVQSCGTTSLMTCLKTNIPGFHPGKGNDGSHGNENGDEHE